jgi:sugar fermentation stimulation protein A
MRGVRCFSPNDKTHPAFGDALRSAKAAEVNIIALDCEVSPSSLDIKDFVPVELSDQARGLADRGP